MGFDPLRSSREDSIYRHCLRAIDLVLDRRMGAHGLPLMGTGDWNDGLDEIGSEGKGESVWLGLFLHYILSRMLGVIGRKDGGLRDHYSARLRDLEAAIESTWRGDRYLRAFHDDGTEIGVKGSGVLGDRRTDGGLGRDGEHQPRRGRIVFQSRQLRRPSNGRRRSSSAGPRSRGGTHPCLGRSSALLEGVRESGMYCHGVQWLVGAARIYSPSGRPIGEGQRRPSRGTTARAACRLWLKTSSIPHAVPGEDQGACRRPAQPAGGRHGNDLRPGPDDLERIHGRRRVDVPPGGSRGCWASGSSRGRSSRPPTFAPAWRPEPGAKSVGTSPQPDSKAPAVLPPRSPNP